MLPCRSNFLQLDVCKHLKICAIVKFFFTSNQNDCGCLRPFLWFNFYWKRRPSASSPFLHWKTYLQSLWRVFSSFLLMVMVMGQRGVGRVWLLASLFQLDLTSWLGWASSRASSLLGTSDWGWGMSWLPGWPALGGRERWGSKTSFGVWVLSSLQGTVILK